MPNKDKPKKDNRKMREEYGYGYDLSPDDLDVIGQNDEAKKNNANSQKDKKRVQTGDDYTVNP
ncbi:MULTISPECIES: hypothetical protein [Sporosarcina]|uniref:hypothetical protein n=1 Tax=Sporosarcina TaxID=1569 RepID=UPI002086AB4D|nr:MULTISPECIES: hypothetical protein [unclassified Sporosarcina]GKV64394.1 hypothetical protein NCCP2331_05470 [Sporosarcina sp. NCCP-2331]GLB55139.1 hypothetical protein NCCP2378_09250 [Sporosarcina sp. NCCP-2378]